MKVKQWVVIGLYLLSLGLVDEVVAAKVDDDSLRALLVSSDIREQLRGAEWSHEFRSDNSENMGIINNTLDALLARKESLDKNEVRLVLHLTQALGYSNNKKYIATIQKAKSSGFYKLDKVAVEAEEKY
jgi:5-methylcytosine-specific restriction endonuclease McrBC regulatory subunit McrC